MLGSGVDVRDVAAAAAGDGDLRADLPAALEDEHGAAPPTHVGGTEKTRRSSADDDHVVKTLHFSPTPLLKRHPNEGTFVGPCMGPGDWVGGG